MNRCAGWAWLGTETAYSFAASKDVCAVLPDKETTDAAQVITQLPLQSQPQSQPKGLLLVPVAVAVLTS